jgi:hypothetical protein
MRPISGFDRPLLQYCFVGLAVVLIAVGAWGALSVKRATREIERLHTADLSARVEREQLEARAERERSARESLALQLGRASRGSRSEDAGLPTLTLTPVTRRGPAPPPATVAPPTSAQVIALRLVLPRGADARGTSYQITIRNWSDGATVWSRGRLSATEVDGRRVVQSQITGDVLAPGSYEALLTIAATDGSRQDVASYEVTVGAT